MRKILVVEDDYEIANAIKEYLTEKEYLVYWASTGKEGIEEFKRMELDLILVDIMMPEMDGFKLCKNIRLLSDIPIIILSAKVNELDKVKGLNLGADDYITKPFSLVELEARIQSHLRRYKRYIGIDDKSSLVEYRGGISLEKELKEIYVKGKRINLTKKEFQLFMLMSSNPNRIFTKQEIYENIWGVVDIEGNNTVSVHIKSLREKLGENVKNPKLIETVWGMGYKFIGERIK